MGGGGGGRNPIKTIQFHPTHCLRKLVNDVWLIAWVVSLGTQSNDDSILKQLWVDSVHKLSGLLHALNLWAFNTPRFTQNIV